MTASVTPMNLRLAVLEVMEAEGRRRWLSSDLKARIRARWPGSFEPLYLVDIALAYAAVSNDRADLSKYKGPAG